MAGQFKDRLPEVIEFRRKYGRFPAQNRENEEEIRLYRWIYRYKSSYPPLTNFLKENGIEVKEVKKRLTIEERKHRNFQNFLLIQEYYENNNHSLSGLWKNNELFNWMYYCYHKSSYPPLINFIKKNGIEIKEAKKKLTKEERIHRDYQNFLLIWEYYENNNNHSLSDLWKENKKLYWWYKNHKSSYPPLSEFLDIIEEIQLGNKEAILLYNLKYSSQQ